MNSYKIEKEDKEVILNCWMSIFNNVYFNNISHVSANFKYKNTKYLVDVKCYPTYYWGIRFRAVIEKVNFFDNKVVLSSRFDLSSDTMKVEDFNMNDDKVSISLAAMNVCFEEIRNCNY